MREWYVEAADIIINKLEGGDKVITDEGGLTKYGISQRAYPDLDIANLSFEAAAKIFELDYWFVVRGDDLGFELGTHVADAAYNMGPGTAIKILQRALGTVAVDGRLGPKTLGKAQAMLTNELVARFNSQRCLHYIGVRNFDKNGKGWFNRVFRLHGFIDVVHSAESFNAGKDEGHVAARKELLDSMSG